MTIEIQEGPKVLLCLFNLRLYRFVNFNAITVTFSIDVNRFWFVRWKALDDQRAGWVLKFRVSFLFENVLLLMCSILSQYFFFIQIPLYNFPHLSLYLLSLFLNFNFCNILVHEVTVAVIKLVMCFSMKSIFVRNVMSKKQNNQKNWWSLVFFVFKHLQDKQS